MTDPPAQRSAPALLRRAAAAAVAAAALVSVAPAVRAGEPPPLVVNPSFEEGGAAPSGWDKVEGARDGDTGQASEVALDRATFRHGKASLRLSGGAGTTSWQLVRQKVVVSPGDRITFVAALKSTNVRKEGRQYPNAHAMLELVDAGGARAQLLWTAPVTGSRDWTDVRISAIVPDGVAAAWVGVFLSQSGTLWCDDVRLTVAPASAADAAGRAAAWDAVEGHLRATYPFFGLPRKPEPEAFFAKARKRCLAANDEEAFVAELRASLADLDDLHVWVRRGGKALATAVPSAVRPNVDPAALRAALTEIVDDVRPLAAGRIGTGADAVGYVAITTWQLDEATMARLEKDLDLLADCRALVLDVRMNAGGDETLAQRIASRFAAADVVYAKSQVRDPLDPAAFLPPTDRVLGRRKGAAPDVRPVAVLQGRACTSSCEGFLLMARALPNVTTVGARSRGASANPRPFAVLPDLVLWSSTWRALAPDAASPEDTIEGRGVAPEIEVTETPADGRDPVLARALEHLRP